MNKEILDTLDDLSKRPTTELAMRLMETTVDNMAKDKELERYKNIVDEVIEYIEKNSFDKEEYGKCWFKCFKSDTQGYAQYLLDKLKELKGE